MECPEFCQASGIGGRHNLPLSHHEHSQGPPGFPVEQITVTTAQEPFLPVQLSEAILALGPQSSVLLAWTHAVQVGSFMRRDQHPHSQGCLGTVSTEPGPQLLFRGIVSSCLPVP